MNRDHEAIRNHEHAMAALQSGDTQQLELLERELDGFPFGVDPHIGRRWIIHAIGGGSLESIRWMLSRGVELNFRDEAGYTPVLAALERGGVHRLDLLDLLLRSGAPVNLKGVNDWTPAHMAAARDDVEALRLLVRHGANLSIRTEIDDYATPLEEARILGKQNAVKFLEGAI